MADFEPIAVNTTAEKLEKIANMEINDETLNENSSDNSLPTSKLVYNELKKISENSGGGSNGGLGNFSVWQPNTEYKVGDMVLATWKNEDKKETVIAECNEAHTSSSSFTNDLIIYAVWDMNFINARGDEYGRSIYETYATKEEALKVASSVEYFDIETDGTIYLKPEYRGSAIDFKTNSSIVTDLGETVCKNMNDYSESDNEFGKDGSKISSLPEVLYIPNEVKGTKVTKLAPAMFAYNKRVKQVVLPQGITTIPNECFAYAIHLESVKNLESVTTVEYGSFFASGVLEIDLPNLTTLGQRAFMKSGHLKKIHLGKIATIPDRCFEHCNDLEEITNDGTITTVGSGVFFNTVKLKKADFVSSLTNIGSYAFNRCALNFDWVAFKEKNPSVVFGDYATPLQMAGSSLTSAHYNIKTKERILPAPLRINQGDPRWRDTQLNINETHNTGCRYFSVMNAYCGIRGLNYDNAYELDEINKAIIVEIDEKESTAEAFNNYLYEINPDTNKPVNIGKIMRYTGDGGELILQYDMSTDKLGVIETNPKRYFEKNHYYQLVRISGKAKASWVDLGDRQITNLDLFHSDRSYESMEKWYKNLGLKESENVLQIPENYFKIIKAIQNGSYVVLNVPMGYDQAGGHAIVLYGVNSNGEVLFVDSSAPSNDALEDYTAVTGCMLLQNLVLNAVLIREGKEVFFPRACNFISEGETKTLLNEKTDQIWSILTEVLKTMDLSILKTYYQPITQTKTVDRLIFSVDFEPKIVFFNTTTRKSTLSKNFPTIAEGTVVNGISNETWIKENISNNQPTMTAQISLQKDGNGTLTNQASTNLSLSLISVSQNQSTGKWDITIGGKDFSETVLNRIIGGEGITYNLFVAG